MSSETTTAEQSTHADCPLPDRDQYWNIGCFVTYWSLYYLAAPITYVGLTHANLLKALGNDDVICNTPSAVYQFMTVVPVLAAWFFPQSRFLKALSFVSIGMMAAVTASVAVALAAGGSREICSWIVILHGAVFGAANGFLTTAVWDFVGRGVSHARRGAALGYIFGIGPLFACLGSLLQDAAFEGRLLGGRSFGLSFPGNYLAMFAAATPLFFLIAVSFWLIRIPAAREPETASQSPLSEIKAGIWQFLDNRAVLFAVVIYVVVYSGGNSIFQNLSMHAKTVLGEQTDTLGIQSFLRFGFKAVAGGLLGWLLAAASPRATLLATTSILLVGMGWALTSSGWWFLVTFGILGAGELFGAYFPNYVATASAKPFVRLNIAYLGVLSTLIGFSSLAFGKISERFGRHASFVVAAVMLVGALGLILALLPAHPMPVDGVDDSPRKGRA